MKVAGNAQAPLGPFGNAAVGSEPDPLFGRHENHSVRLTAHSDLVDCAVDEETGSLHI